jgi:hypothetical protein
MLNTSLRLDPIKTSPTKTSGLKLDPIKLDPPLTYKDSTFHKGVNALRETVMGPVEAAEGLISGITGYGVGATAKAIPNAIFDYMGIPNPIPALRSSKPYMEQIEEVAGKFATPPPTTESAKRFFTPADVSPDDPTITAALKRAVTPMNVLADVPVAAGTALAGTAKGLGFGEPAQFLARMAGEFAGGAKVFKKGGELKSIARDALLKDKPKPSSPVELRLDSKELDRMAVEPIEPVEPAAKRFISEEQVPKAEVKPKEHTIFDEEYESLELPGEEISTILDKTNSEGIAKELNLKYNGAMGKGDKEIFMFTEPDYGATFSVKVGDDVAMKLQSKVAEFEKAGNEKIIPERSKIEQKAGEKVEVPAELHRSLDEILGDINTSLGTKGAVGKDIGPRTPEQTAARQRLQNDLDGFKEEAWKVGKSLNEYMKVYGLKLDDIPVTPFYSKLEQVVDSKVGGKIEVEQLKKTLLNNGVTPAEYSKVFGELSGVVTKQKLRDEMVLNGTKFEDVVLGESDVHSQQLRDINLLEASGKITRGEATNRILALPPDTPTHFSMYVEPGAKEGSYRELFVTAPREVTEVTNLPTRIRLGFPEKEKISMVWQDGHSAYSNISNPIVRIRFNEREIDGKRTLFVEEIQGPSDANQARMPESLRKRIYDIGVKRVLAYAKENGFDKVAWTTGEMQAKRYDLSKQVDSIIWRREPHDNRRVHIAIKNNGTEIISVKPDGTIITDGPFKNKDIAEVIGKEFGEKIKKQEAGTYAGLDLKVGGEGLKRLYDVTIPSLVKKYGKEGVEEIGKHTPYNDARLQELNRKSADADRLVQEYDDKIVASGNKDALKALNLGQDSIYNKLAKDADNAYKEALAFSASLEEFRGVGRVPSTPITAKTPESFTLYSGIDPTKIVDLGKRAAGLTKEAHEILKEKSPVIKSVSDMAHVGTRELKHLLYDPQSVLHKDPNASKSFWRFVDAEEGSNRFIDPHFTEYTKATKGIKKGSDSDARVADALDGVISPDTLTTKERTAYNFFKTNYDFLIHKAARTFAGSEEAYQRVLHYVSNKMPKRSKIADLDAARLQEYNTLAAQAREIRGNRKVNELKGDDLLEYRDKRQEMIDFLNKDFIDKLPEGEREAYIILSRRIEQYFPHMFEPKELIKIFELDIKELKDNLAKIDIQVRATMGKTVLTRSEKRLLTRAKTYTEKLQKLESAVVNLKGGKYISFRNLPGEISFRFFNPRTGKKGYGRSALKSYETYLFGLARKMYDEPARKQVVKEWFNDVDPELKPYLQAFMDRYMGHDTSPLNKIANAITTFEWIRTLGFNPRSALVNLSQNVNTLAYVGEKYVVEAGKMLLTDHARAKELFAETGIAREVPNVLTEGGKSAGLEVLNNAARFMFNNVELGNRKIAFIAGYLKGKDAGIKRGLTKEALEAFAKKKGMETVHETQFRYGKLGMPKLFWSPVGRVAFQFSSYPLKQIRFLYRLMKNDPVALIKYIGYTTGINYTLQEFLDIDLSNALGVGITWGELFSAIKSAGEGDTKGALRHLKQTVELGSGLLPSGPGPVASGLLSIAEAAGQGKGMQQLGKELMPIMAARLIEAYTAVRDSSDGEYPVKDTKGHLKYRLTGKQLFQRTFGPKTAEEKRVSLNYSKARNLELERREVLNEMTVAIIEGDDDTLIDLATKYKIVPTDEQIMNELKRRNMTLEEMGRSRKQMEYQLNREGEIY